MIKYLHNDKDIAVCIKPAGMAVQSANIREKDLVSYVMIDIARENRKNGIREKNIFLSPINRIDREVEGLVLLAKTKKAAAILSKQMTDKDIEKRYLAVCFGDISKDVVHMDKKEIADNNFCKNPYELKDDVRLIENLVTYISDYIYKEKNIAKIVEKTDAIEAKKASLWYKVIASKGNLNLLEIKLETGRFHQIRAMFSNMHSPIFGDIKYGFDDGDYGSEYDNTKKIALCSFYLKFKHPISGENLVYEYKPAHAIFSEFIK